MRCPYCHRDDTQVTDSRLSPDGSAVKRRRRCKYCTRRFTTYERVERMTLTLVKKDNRREPYSRQKLQRGIELASTKRPVPADSIEDAVNSIEAELYNMGSAEVSADVVGDLVMRKLRELDEVAYIRFASVYRNFADLEDLRAEVEGLVAQGPQEEAAEGETSSARDAEPRSRGKKNGTK